MSKIIDSLVQASIDSQEYAGVILAQLHFTPTFRVCNAYQSIYWDEAGTGEQEYLGAGEMAGMSILGETAELAAESIQLTLSGIPNSTITEVFANDYIGQPVFIWYGTLDKQTYAVEGGQNGPVLIFAGRMEYSNIQFGETATITVNATSRLADWERPRGGRFNMAYQNNHVDPTDRGFRQVKALQNLPVSWGGVTVLDPGTDDPTGGYNQGRRDYNSDER